MNSAEENAVGEKQGQIIVQRDAIDYARSSKSPYVAVLEGGMQSSNSGDAFRNEEYLSGHVPNKQGARSNRVVNNTGPYNSMNIMPA